MRKTTLVLILATAVAAWLSIGGGASAAVQVHTDQ